MARLRNTWIRTFNKAMAVLRSKDNPIARYTVKLIDSKKIEVLPYAKMEEGDYLALRDEHSDADKTKFSVMHPLVRKAVQILHNNWWGRIYDNRIYICDVKNPTQFARIIVHEVNHYINDSNNHYETNEDIFTEELRAHIAEALVFSRETRNYLTTIAKDVCDKYELSMPEQPIKMPKGLFYR